MKRAKITIDGNEAAAYSAYHVNQVISIYPITPASPMCELADQWAVEERPNIWGSIPQVTEMQSEGGVAGVMHGSLQTGALSTTFTASQGLLLMIPNMFKIAGELTPTVFHVSARTLATHALSIFCDHSDVMATRSTGFALLASNSVQEVMDLGLIAQAATLETRLPFLHFFDGFRTSHEICKVEQLSLDDMREMIDDELVRAHRERALSPEHPVIRGTAQNPDVFFQARERGNPYYFACPDIVQKIMDKFEKVVGRKYSLFQYLGAEEAECVVVLMGSGAETAEETVKQLLDQGESVGLLKVRLYRPFSIQHFSQALPQTVRNITVLDRTKEPGSIGEPLYMDVVSAIQDAVSIGAAKFKRTPRVIGGRYGLSSKEFTPAMVRAVFAEMKKDSPKNHFTIGINDDVTHTSLEYDSGFSTEPSHRTRAVFYGLGSDGTVSANRNSIRIIGEQTDNFAQGYFVYDSRKAGSLTISHLRFGPDSIHSPYLINRANFVGCHQFAFLDRFDVLKVAEEEAIFLLNSPYGPKEVWDRLPLKVQEQIIIKKLRFFGIDAYRIAREVGLGPRINTIMQVCFFALSKIIPEEEAMEYIKEHIRKAYGKGGEAVVSMNFAAVDKALDNLHQVAVPKRANSPLKIRPPVPGEAPEFVQKVLGKIIAGEGDALPVSAFSPDGTFPTGTTQWENRNIALEIPVWDPNVCIQCGRCVLVCPHAVIRAKVYPPESLQGAPPSFKSTEASWRIFTDMCYTLQVSPEDCTGCALCVRVCPAKNKKEPGRRAINMEEQAPVRDQESGNWGFFLDLPEVEGKSLRKDLVKDVQLIRPLFEFSGACGGCGETPYLKLLSQLFGDHALIANSTGCSSIYGGNLPTTPWAFDRQGKGPAWSNSLFEDNAEFGLGMRLALDGELEFAKRLLKSLSSQLSDELVGGLGASQESANLEKQRQRVTVLKKELENMNEPDAKKLLEIADTFVKKSVWIVGGDGWSYDIGYGGLDHVLASGRNVNVLVLDTEVYSNTGGQMSKATPLGAVAKFAAGGKSTPKKDLALIFLTYGNVFIARVAMGANYTHTLKAFLEAEAYQGPSLIIAYSHCIAHGYDLAYGMDQQKAAVLSGYWPLLRYNPNLVKEGKNPLQLDSEPPGLPLEEYIYNETRYRMLVNKEPVEAKHLLQKARDEISKRWRLYQHLAAMPMKDSSKEEGQ